MKKVLGITGVLIVVVIVTSILNPDFLTAIWWDEIGKLFTKLRETGRIDLLDNHLGGDGLDITIAPPLPGKK